MQFSLLKELLQIEPKAALISQELLRLKKRMPSKGEVYPLSFSRGRNTLRASGKGFVEGKMAFNDDKNDGAAPLAECSFREHSTA